MKLTDSPNNALGYSIVFKRVLMDPRVSCGAKGLYAYLCGYAGTKRIAFPSLSKIKTELHLSKSTIYKYADELKEKGYILTKNYARRQGSAKKKHYFIRYHEEVDKDKFEFEEMVRLSLNKPLI